MKNHMVILIADRSRRVREFIKREISMEDYKVILAKDGCELVQQLDSLESLDLLILDPDFPDIDDIELIDKIIGKFPDLPIILHSYPLNNNSAPPVSNSICFVEKKGNSIEMLKKTVFSLLKQETKPEQRIR